MLLRIGRGQLTESLVDLSEEFVPILHVQCYALGNLTNEMNSLDV